MIKTDNIIENEELENKWFMASQEYIDAMNDHYTEPDIEDPELSQTQIDKLKAVMDLKSGGYRVPFKTLCEALGIDYDQWKEDIEAGPPIDYIDEPLVSAVKNNDNLEFESFCIENNLNSDITLDDIIDGSGMSFHIPSGAGEIDFKNGPWNITDDMILNSRDLWGRIADDSLLLTDLSTRVKNKVKPDNKKKPENFTTIEQDMLEVLLDD